MIRSALTCLCLVIAALTAQAQTIAITGGNTLRNLSLVKDIGAFVCNQTQTRSHIRVVQLLAELF